MSDTAAPESLPRRSFLWRLRWRGVVSIVAFFVLWHLAVKLQLSGFAELPTPGQTITAFFADYLTNPEYWSSWVVSFKRVFYGFIIAQILGIPLGLLFGTSPGFRNLLFPVFELLRPIPPLAWVPISILFWPTNESSIVFITFIGAFFVIVINVYDGVSSIKNEHVWLARSLGASRMSIFRRIMLPSVIPSIAVGMTLGIAITWNVVIAAEMIASDSGLGRMTWEGYVSSTPEVVLIGMISIGLAGFLSSIVVDWIEKRMMPWQRIH
ncbi:MAG: ABC transporter permease [Gammaproteobacteria bacterium]|jgi:NitT/TauT family transport system permease protein